MLIVFSGIVLAIWIYLVCARAGFWRCSVRDDAIPPTPGRWPSITAVVPARDEADCIRESLGSLLRQDYAGPFSIVLVDDDSRDGTAAIARETGVAVQPERALAILANSSLPPGWTGKLWALKRGIEVAEEKFNPDYLLLTDADIVHAPDSLSALVARASAGQFVLTSLMAKLRCISLAERSHVPAFVYFFQMLFPFAWVGQRHSSTAAAAGGCMLVRADALRNSGGIDAIRNALIDDCALARQLKTQGSIWLGLTGRVRSIRAYESFADVKQMISRSAYAQLHFSPLLLAATIAGMLLVFVAPPVLAVFANGEARWFGIAAWLLMAISFQPMLRFYRLSPLWGIALPAIALLYAVYTIDSAYRHARRRGGSWKGRVHVDAPSLQ
ncbi:MAG TPA: glycosyltransferase, partial [Pseudolabrys sp.]|nr:glycosyltransferase [Pseudolabrys sp.]